MVRPTRPEYRAMAEVWRQCAALWRNAECFPPVGAVPLFPRWAGGRRVFAVGLCGTLTHLDVPSSLTDRMSAQMHRHKPRGWESGNDGFWWPRTEAGARSRVRFCVARARQCERLAAR